MIPWINDYIFNFSGKHQQQNKTPCAPRKELVCPSHKGLCFLGPMALCPMCSGVFDPQKGFSVRDRFILLEVIQSYYMQPLKDLH